MPHVHLPLQSASDQMLRAMQRSYTLEGYERVLARLRERLPGAAVSTDIIVGFPGETDQDFEATRAYMARTRFDSAFLFKYSARPDTRAWKLAETVSEEEKGRRLQVLIDQQHQVSGEIMDGFLGRELEVLVEGPSLRGRGVETRQLHGKSREFKTVVWPDDGSPAGSLQRVRVVGATPVTLLGESLAGARAQELVTIG
jgi:tRNA-2-methylthio-N6-dimethylallyladenosine synthase